MKLGRGARAGAGCLAVIAALLLVVVALQPVRNPAQSRRQPGMVMADDIAVAHTPPGGYGNSFPPPVLSRCTEPLVADTQNCAIARPMSASNL